MHKIDILHHHALDKYDWLTILNQAYMYTYFTSLIFNGFALMKLPVKTLFIQYYTYISLLVFTFIGWQSNNSVAHATSLLAKYTVQISGISVGRGFLKVSLGNGHYKAEAYGKTVYVAKLMSTGKGGAHASGSFNEDKRPLPTYFSLQFFEDDKNDNVRMDMQEGNIKSLVANPPTKPHSMRIPLTKEHKRNIVDPLSSLLVSVPGTGPIKGHEACNRTIPIFDGRQRFDIALRYIRTVRVRGRDRSYTGPVIVCQVAYRPIAGHRSNRRVTQQLMQNKDIFIWFAPIGQTRILAPWRVDIGLPYGKLRVSAKRFLVSEK